MAGGLPAIASRGGLATTTPTPPSQLQDWSFFILCTLLLVGVTCWFLGVGCGWALRGWLARKPVGFGSGETAWASNSQAVRRLQQAARGEDLSPLREGPLR